MSIKNNNRPVADNVARIIAELGLKQRAVAEKAGFEAQAFSDMLNGRRIMRAVDIASIINVMGEFGVDANYLFGIEKGA